MTSAIETFGLTKKYGATTAVADLNLRIEPGQVFGFLGPNGAGKSTTIRMLLALQRPTKGRATLLGLDAAADSVEVHRRIGYLPGDLELFPRLTGHQHIAWFMRARRVGDDSLAKRLIDRFQVVADRPVRELSKGNRQKIGLVIAFMHRPELLILDEPTSGLDPLMQHEFESLLRETADEGRTWGALPSSPHMSWTRCSASRIGSELSRKAEWWPRTPWKGCAEPRRRRWKARTGSTPPRTCAVSNPCADLGSRSCAHRGRVQGVQAHANRRGTAFKPGA